MLIIISTIVVRFRSFDSTILLKTLSYDIAFSVWESRSFALGVVRSTEGFRSSYGVSFAPNSEDYELFEYTNASDPDAIPKNESTGGASVERVELFTLGRSFEIDETCVVTVSDEICEGIDRLDISFKRPEHTAFFYAEGFSGSPDEIERAIVRVREEGGERYGQIEVGYAGQITVTLVDD